VCSSRGLDRQVSVTHLFINASHPRLCCSQDSWIRQLELGSREFSDRSFTINYREHCTHTRITPTRHVHVAQGHRAANEGLKLRRRVFRRLHEDLTRTKQARVVFGAAAFLQFAASSFQVDPLGLGNSNTSISRRFSVHCIGERGPFFSICLSAVLSRVAL